LFSLDQADRVAVGSIPVPTLARLVEYWRKLQVDALPSLSDLDPRLVLVEPGRVHLLRVEAPGLFRFLHYGASVTNPDARDMTGLTTADYEDHAFGELVRAHYQEAVDERQPVCRLVKGSWNGAEYRYMRLTLPFGLHGKKVEFLVVCTHRIAVPEVLDRHPNLDMDPAKLREISQRSRRLAAQVNGHDVGVGLEGVAIAADLRFAEATLLAVKNGAASSGQDIRGNGTSPH
jgi:hypothetical protein